MAPGSRCSPRLPGARFSACASKSRLRVDRPSSRRIDRRDWNHPDSASGRHEWLAWPLLCREGSCPWRVRVERWVDLAMVAHELGGALAPTRNALQLLDGAS